MKRCRMLPAYSLKEGGGGRGRGNLSSRSSLRPFKGRKDLFWVRGTTAFIKENCKYKRAVKKQSSLKEAGSSPFKISFNLLFVLVKQSSDPLVGVVSFAIIPSLVLIFKIFSFLFYMSFWLQLRFLGDWIKLWNEEGFKNIFYSKIAIVLIFHDFSFTSFIVF